MDPPAAQSSALLVASFRRSPDPGLRSLLTSPHTQSALPSLTVPDPRGTGEGVAGGSGVGSSGGRASSRCHSERRPVSRTRPAQRSKGQFPGDQPSPHGHLKEPNRGARRPVSYRVWPHGSQEGPNLNLGTRNLIFPLSFWRKLAPNSEKVTQGHNKNARGRMSSGRGAVVRPDCGGGGTNPYSCTDSERHTHVRPMKPTPSEGVSRTGSGSAPWL